MASLNALPEKYKNSLDASQLHRYRKTDPLEYFGNDLSPVISKEIEFIRQLGEYPKAKEISRAILKLFIFFRSVFKKTNGFHKQLKKERDFFVELSQRFRPYLNVKQFVKLIGLDENTFRNWITEVRVRCSNSLINSCRKIHPNQLLPAETDKMKKLLTDSRFQLWPLISIYYYALRNNLCSMSISTWYKYSRLLNINRLKPRSVKIYGFSVKAKFPNQYWHADVTKFRTMDGVWNYIYTVVDNYSKFPLAVYVSDILSGKIRMQTFRDALKKAIELSPEINTINLIVDGGSENFNGTVDEFLKNPGEIKIYRIRALRDVIFSNSVAEAFNRILKTYYLNHRSVLNNNELIIRVEESVNDFSFNRPHAILKGLTPFEAITGKHIDVVNYSEQIQLAKRMRVQLNTSYDCQKCKFK